MMVYVVDPRTLSIERMFVCTVRYSVIIRKPQEEILHYTNFILYNNLSLCNIV